MERRPFIMYSCHVLRFHLLKLTVLICCIESKVLDAQPACLSFQAEVLMRHTWARLSVQSAKRLTYLAAIIVVLYTIVICVFSYATHRVSELASHNAEIGKLGAAWLLSHIQPR
jgi:hypothetical protein